MCTEDQNQTLATSSGLGSITVCGCGTISVHVGGVSVRMELSAFVQTAEMFRMAIAQLETRSLQSTAPKTPNLLTH
jgi:hypothetical protein